MMIMVSATELLALFIGLEIMSIALYILVGAYYDDSLAYEAAFKYFLNGAFASAIMLYGIALLYGHFGSTNLSDFAFALRFSQSASGLLLLGSGLLFAGFAFKVALVPFHMWVPDVYHGAPTSVTLFIGSAPKIAAFAMAIRLLVDGMSPLLEDWRHMLVILAVLSMATGNIIAIAQTNLKRMLAYSTIAHIGFLLLGIISGNQAGYAGAMFYVIIYALMSMGAFGMVILLGRKGHDADLLEDFKGLSDRSPWFAFIMLILMFSMAGVPPFVGFWAKWFVIKEVIAAGHVFVAGLAVIFSVIGAYYYLRIVKLMYFDKPANMARTTEFSQRRN